MQNVHSCNCYKGICSIVLQRNLGFTEKVIFFEREQQYFLWKKKSSDILLNTTFKNNSISLLTLKYHTDFQALFDWVDIAGGKLASMSPVGTDLETVKQQTEELKVWISH